MGVSWVRQWASPPTTSTPLLASFPDIDDEDELEERRQRRKSAVIDQQRAPESPFRGSEGELAARQVAKKKRPPKKTVEQNLSNINISETERKCEAVWLSQHSLKPSSSVQPCEDEKPLSGELGEGIGDDNYNNARDTANFCPSGLQGGDSDDDGEGLGGPDDVESSADGAPASSQDRSCYGEDDLVPQPQRVRRRRPVWSNSSVPLERP